MSKHIQQMRTTTVDCAESSIPNKRPLPAGWRWVRLGEVCRIVSGSTPSSSVPEFWNGELVWITPTDLGSNDGNIINTCARKISRFGYDSCGTEQVPVGTVVMSSRAPIGHLGLAGVPLCTNQGCKSFVPKDEVDSLFLFYILRKHVPELRELGSGATFKEVSKTTLEQFEIAIPSFSEQKRIAAILNEQMAEVERARAAAETQLEVARKLPAAYLREVFNGAEAQKWPRKRFSDVIELRPAKSIATHGDTEVLAITTACLTEEGFNPSGTKQARMRANDAVESLVSKGEILLARSNTPELVGRAAMYDGNPPNAVSSDLTIRLWPTSGLLSPFVASYLSHLYLTGYWKERAGGASGTMKKITRTQIMQELLPVPSLDEQKKVVHFLSGRIELAVQLRKFLEVNLAIVNELPVGLLQKACSGEL